MRHLKRSRGPRYVTLGTPVEWRFSKIDRNTRPRSHSLRCAQFNSSLRAAEGLPATPLVLAEHAGLRCTVLLADQLLEEPWCVQVSTAGSRRVLVLNEVVQVANSDAHEIERHVAAHHERNGDHDLAHADRCTCAACTCMMGFSLPDRMGLPAHNRRGFRRCKEQATASRRRVHAKSSCDVSDWSYTVQGPIACLLAPHGYYECFDVRTESRALAR